MTPITDLCDRLERIYRIATDRVTNDSARLVMIANESEGFAPIPPCSICKQPHAEPEQDCPGPTEEDRRAVLARFIRNQVSLADRPPPGCIQLNNDEATRCAEALEAVVDDWGEITYSFEDALRLARLWRAGKLIGGDRFAVIDALLTKIELMLATHAANEQLVAGLRKLHADIVQFGEGCESPAIALVRRAADALETTAKPARDADHCDFPDCEQHWSAVVDRAIAAMTKFHATFASDDDADLTPRTTPEAFREFVDEHARLMRIRASGSVTPRIQKQEPLT